MLLLNHKLLNFDVAELVLIIIIHRVWIPQIQSSRCCQSLPF